MRRTLQFALLAALLAAAAAAQDEAKTLYQQGRDAYNAANALQREKKYAEAAAAYLQMAKAHPTHEMADNALYQAGAAANTAKDRETATVAFEALLKDYPGSSQRLSAISTLASLYRSLQPAKAASLYERLAGEEFSGYSGRDSVLQNAIGALRTAKDYEGALRLIDKAAAIIPHQGSTWGAVLGYKIDALLALEKADDAVAAADEMAKLYPGDQVVAAAYRRVADHFNRQREYSKAAGMYLKGAEYPGYGSALASYSSAASALTRQDPPDTEGALRIYRRYIDEYPNGAHAQEFHLRLTALYRGPLKDRQKEIETCKAFVGKYPKSMLLDQMILSLGRAYQETEKPAEAIAAYLELLEKAPQSDLAAQAMYRLGQAYIAAGDNAKAKAIYQRVVAEKPGYNYADQAAARLAGMK